MPRRVIAIATLLASCTFANQFDVKHVDRLVLGELKVTEYEELFGDQASVSKRTTADGAFVEVRYEEHKHGFQSSCARYLFLEFRDGALNGFFFGNTCDGAEKTHGSKDAALRFMSGIGAATKAQVLEHFGEPTGRARCPSLLGRYEEKCKRGYADVWSWLTPGERNVFSADEGAIGTFASFDDQGILADLEIIEP